MNNFKAGYAKLVITPPLGASVEGYFIKRYAKEILDDLYVRAVAFSVGDKRAVIISADILNVKKDGAAVIKNYVAESLGLDPAAVFFHCTHTHTAPLVIEEHETELARDYFKFVKLKARDVAALALADMKPARLGYSENEAKRISFGRRYRMKDGTVRTNPGVKNPDIVEPVGIVDEQVNVIRIDREGADSIAIINFSTHPDTIGGEVISADWPGFTVSTFEAALGDVKCLFVNGAQGDVNHVNVCPLPGEENWLHKDFDDVDRGYEHSKHMGRVVAGAALQAWGKARYVDIDSIDYAEKVARVPANIPDPSEIPDAEKYNALHKEGRDDELPYKGMMLTTMLARWARILRMQNGPEFFDVPLTVLRLGDLAFIGIAGEPFTGIGMALKAIPDFDKVIPCCLVNGSCGYFPMMDSYAEGGYESESSSFKAGVAEIIIEEGTKLAKSVR